MSVAQPPTVATLLLAAASGLWLYQVKHRAEALDGQIARTLGQIAATRERIGPLLAEWTLLENRRRLDALARRHLNLRPLAASQFAALPDLGSRLAPRPGPAHPGPGTASWPISAHTRKLGRR